jgi:hypothetical protein
MNEHFVADGFQSIEAAMKKKTTFSVHRFPVTIIVIMNIFSATKIHLEGSFEVLSEF